MSGGWRPTPFLSFSAGVHALSLAGVAVSPASWPLAAGALAANHLAIATAAMLPRCSWLGANLTHRPAGAAADVVLTFDDGPDPAVTPRVLDLLDGAGARASFFCIGRRAERHPGLVAEIVRRGHLVENHTYRHLKRFALLGPRAMAREIDRAQEALAKAAGRRPIYFRAPAGIRSPWLDPLLARRGLRLVSWTRRGFDTADGRAERVAHRLLRGLGPGDILLLHDIALTPHTQPAPVVLDALRRALNGLDEAGYRAVPLPESADLG